MRHAIKLYTVLNMNVKPLSFGRRMNNLLTSLTKSIFLKQLISGFTVFLLVCFYPIKSIGQPVPVGSGSYSTALPPGAVGP